MNNDIEIEKLFNELLESGKPVVKHNDYELINADGIKVQTKDGKFVNVLAISRHKTPKHLIKLTIKSENFNSEIIVTTDHVCMTYDRDKVLQNINAKNLNINDYVQIFDSKNNIEIIGTISEIKDLGISDEYVYDLEVDDDLHAFYANDILVHNSQFVDMTCVTEHMRKKYNLTGPIHSWPQDKRREIWDLMAEFTNKEVNQFVRDLVHTYCHTNEQNVLTYELEYMGSVGIYEGKKHYAVRKIFEEGDEVDKVKYTGIELKKNVLDKAMKGFLAEIYHGVLYEDWMEANYQEYIANLYDKFTGFTVDQLAFWKGYNTAREATGFLQMQVGTTGIAKACSYYNQIIEKLGLGKKYDEIRVGDKVRQIYLKSSNSYGIDTIAYKPGQWPKEFDEIFQIDYKKMFDKIILDPLKRFREACRFQTTDPSKTVIQDIFAL